MLPRPVAANPAPVVTAPSGSSPRKGAPKVAPKVAVEVPEAGEKRTAEEWTRYWERLADDEVTEHLEACEQFVAQEEAFSPIQEKLGELQRSFNTGLLPANIQSFAENKDLKELTKTLVNTAKETCTSLVNYTVKLSKRKAIATEITAS